MVEMSRRYAYALAVVVSVLSMLGGVWILSGALDRDPPVVYAIYLLPPEPKAGGRVVVHIFGDDRSGIEQVEVFYRINASSWEHSVMERVVLLCCPPRWLHDFGTFSTGTAVDYYFVLTDQSALHLTTTTETFTFEVVGPASQDERGDGAAVSGSRATAASVNLR